MSPKPSLRLQMYKMVTIMESTQCQQNGNIGLWSFTETEIGISAVTQNFQFSLSTETMTKFSFSVNEAM